MNAVDPSFPSGVRPFRAGDEAAILAAMHAALARGEYEGVDRHWVEQSARAMCDEPGGTAVAEDGGRLAGWIAPREDVLTVDLPFRRRGHGRRLVAAGRLLAARAGLPHLRLWVPRREGPEAFARAVGLRYHSSLWRLVLPAGAPAAEPRFPDDVLVRPIVPGADEPAFVELQHASFDDHPSPLRLDIEEVRRVHARPDFDPSTVLLVSPTGDPGRLVAFCRIKHHLNDEGRRVGEVALVGVLPGHRGRGLGRELVRWGVDEVRRRGAVDVYLSVEGENAGALRLYASLGFRQDTEWPHWVMEPATPEPVTR